MKGVIVVPTFYGQEPAQSMGAVIKHKAMYTDLCKKYNFSYVCTDTPNLDGYDVAVIQNVPYHNRPSLPPGILEAKCKLIGEFGDLQCWGSKECLENKEILFNRCDILIGSFYEKFKEWYPQHINKYVHWPKYFAPYEKYSNLPINTNPIMRCLLIGAHGGHAYPLREYIVNSRNQHPNNGYVDVVGPGQIPFPQYPKYLNGYFCSLALSGIFNGAVAKYFEIPAAGVLMLAREVEEIKVCGLKPYVHYVPVTKENVFNKIREVLEHPNDYIEIRNTATKFVLENHSDVNRINTFKDIFNQLLPNGHNSLLRAEGI